MIMRILIYEYVVLLNFIAEYKTRSKMKIKKLLKSKHDESRNQRIVVETFVEFTYKMITFSNASTRINSSEIFVVFTYKLNLFFDRMKNLKTFEFEIFDSTYDFDVSNIQNNHLTSCNCDESKTLFL